MSEFRDDMTLKEARDALRELAEVGHTCPCCKQFAKIYRRKVNSAQVQAAIALWRAAGREFAHLPSLDKRFAGNGGDISKLRYWGLVEEERTLRPDGGRAGIWRMTHRGELFVRGIIMVKKYAHIYDGRCLKLSGELVDVRECLGEKFDYAELMYGGKE